MARAHEDESDWVCDLQAMHQAAMALTMKEGWAEDPENVAAVRGLLEVMSGPLTALKNQQDAEHAKEMAALKAAYQNGADPHGGNSHDGTIKG